MIRFIKRYLYNRRMRRIKKLKVQLEGSLAVIGFLEKEALRSPVYHRDEYIAESKKIGKLETKIKQLENRG